MVERLSCYASLSDEITRSSFALAAAAGGRDRMSGGRIGLAPKQHNAVGAEGITAAATHSLVTNDRLQQGC